MIILQVMGGLGNQMFQYACGRSIASRLGTDLLLDTRLLEEKDQSRDYGLGCFSIRGRVMSQKEFSRRLRDRLRRRLSRSLRKKDSVYTMHGRLDVVREQGLGYAKELEQLTGDAYLSGYWQSEKYFLHMRNEIKCDFALSVPVSAEINNLVSRISEHPSVSIHVRRGDYLVNTVHGLCTMSYYQRAWTSITERLHIRPTPFVFSDDPEWVRQNFDIGADFVPIDTTPDRMPQEDLFCMAQCDHHILANSSFSWWGAWLNESPDSVVIAPDPWFISETLHNADLIPERWTTVPDALE